LLERGANPNESFEQGGEWFTPLKYLAKQLQNRNQKVWRSGIVEYEIHCNRLKLIDLINLFLSYGGDPDIKRSGTNSWHMLTNDEDRDLFAAMIREKTGPSKRNAVDCTIS
jgi:hypothetical protein